MKIIVYLPLLTCALLLGWYLFGDSNSQPRSPAANSSQTVHGTGTPSAVLSPAVRPEAIQVPAERPPSLRGTEVDGQLEVDDQGNLLVSSQIRHLFDYFLSLIGEEDAGISQQRIRQYLAEQLPQPARGQALDLLDSYLAYQRRVVELESRFMASDKLDELIARQQAVQQLRASLFSRQAHEAFFAGEELYHNFTLERLTINRDELLSQRQKAAAIEALRVNLPEEMQQLLVPQIQNDLRQQTLALREAGANDSAIRELRLDMLGPEATTRLEELDQRRAEWRERVAAFDRERATIMAQPGLAVSDRQAAVDALLLEQFTETERLRLGN